MAQGGCFIQTLEFGYGITSLGLTLSPPKIVMLANQLRRKPSMSIAIRLAEPRGGVVATCRPRRSDVAQHASILVAVTQTDLCIKELKYNGFFDENALLAAGKPR